MVNENKSITRALNLAARYLSFQARTLYEMQKYLDKKGLDKQTIKETLAILRDKNYLNDKEFARLFVQNRIKNKPKSKFALGYDLKKKGISASDYDAVLSPYNDQELAVKAVKPKINAWQALDDDKFKKKMMNFLQYRGFNYEICLSTLNHFLSKENDHED